jgi:glycine hydroxymethyltransferase
MSFLKEFDEEVFNLCEKELERQTDHLEMIASENFTLPAYGSYGKCVY